VQNKSTNGTTSIIDMISMKDFLDLIHDNLSHPMMCQDKDLQITPIENCNFIQLTGCYIVFTFKAIDMSNSAFYKGQEMEDSTTIKSIYFIASLSC
jgi:hypothetical protein